MFSQVLDCPYCRNRFNYEQTTQAFPAQLTCPECGQTGPYEDFSAIVLCHQCRKKVRVPLELLYNDDTLCPHCQTVLKADLPFLDEDASTYTLGGTRHSRADERILKDGEFFDKYKIIRLLGKGGMAEVYLAEHLLLKKQCALKLMQSSVAAEDQIFTKRFIREAKLTHQLVHPNIVNVFDAGSDFKTGYLFLAMEYVEGKTLSQLFREKKLSEQELMAVLISMINALKVLEEAHVVHRDIKPSNIMLDSSGIYKLMDLGIAKTESDHPAGEMTLTMEQSVIGTPGYASPEQCRSAHNVDIRSDLYCLGATLYHAASGVIPHDGETPMEIILKVLQDEPEPLKTFRPDLSPGFLSVIEKMMMKKPDDRPATPEAVLDLLWAGSGKFSSFCQKLFFSISSRINFAAPAAFLINVFPVVQKLAKTAFCLALLGAIILAGHYLLLYSFNKTKGSFTEYIGTLGSKSETKTETKIKKEEKKSVKHNLSRNAHPLMQYPGEEDKQRYKHDNDLARTPLFPVVTFTGQNVPDTLIEFDKIDPRNQKRLAEIHQDGILHWDKLKKYPFAIFYLPSFLHAQDAAFSIDLKVTSFEKLSRFNIGFINVYIADGELTISPSVNYQTTLPVKIPLDRWFNLTIALEQQKRKITIFSGNRLLGIYLLPRKIFIHFSFVHASFSGKFERFVFYKKVPRYTLPPEGRRQYAPIRFSTERLAPAPELNKFQERKKTAQAASALPAPSEVRTRSEQPAPSQPERNMPSESASRVHKEIIPQNPAPGPRDIACRIRECHTRLDLVRNSPDSPLKAPTIEFIQKQLKELALQQINRRDIEAAKRKNYSPELTRRLADRVAYFLKNRYKGHFNTCRNGQPSQYVLVTREIRRLLKSATDPNLKIDYKPYSNYTGDYYLANFCSRNKQYLPLLIDKKVDTSRLNFKELAPELCLFGREDVDGENGDLLFHLAHQIIPSRRRFRAVYAGQMFESKYINQLLLQAPRLDAAHPHTRETLMHLAARRNNSQLIRNLALAGFNQPYARDFRGLTPWQTALYYGNAQALNELKILGFETDHTPEMENHFNFCQSLLKKDYDKMIKHLKAGADPYREWYNRINALQNAAAMDDTSAVKILLENGVDPARICDPRGGSGRPVNNFYAITVSTGNAQILDLILKRLPQSPDTNRNHADAGLIHELWLRLYHIDNDAASIISLLEVLRRNNRLDFNTCYHGNPLILRFTGHIPQAHTAKFRELVRYLLRYTDSGHPRLQRPGMQHRLQQILDPNYNKNRRMYYRRNK